MVNLATVRAAVNVVSSFVGKAKAHQSIRARGFAGSL